MLSLKMMNDEASWLLESMYYHQSSRTCASKRVSAQAWKVATLSHNCQLPHRIQQWSCVGKVLKPEVFDSCR